MSANDPSAQDKRDRLSKALGAAFLSHQVESLERSVDSLTFSCDGRLLPPPRPTSTGRTVQVNSTSNHRNGPIMKGGSDTRSGTSGVKRPIKVVDASVLVHALPVVKRWLRQDTHQLVIPLQAFSTLDALKKAPAALYDLAHEATRFLESQLAIAQRIEMVLGGPGPEADAKIRLRAQAAGEEVSWEQVEQFFQIPPKAYPLVNQDPPVDSENEGPTDVIEPRLPSAQDLPCSWRSPLQCALFFASQSPKHLFVLFNTLHLLDVVAPPPPAIPFISGSAKRAPPPSLNYLAISSGDTLARFVQTHYERSIPLYVVPSSEVVAAKEWLKALAKETATAKGNLSQGAKPDSKGSKSMGSAHAKRRSGTTGDRGGAGSKGGRRNGAGTEGKLFVP
ncbi:BQ5605_C002g01685 [Microbotryum silenes-dioicae]|uniref:BQ5605_C002g01685 protein n=1 Tax=Microbotryum silenes-dioicae TaxID=796604 RepID=A0A2X0MLF1_9BASI|nr:BQ5605_C002g01685 [Microbotryum silenes-dioicae]